MTYKLKVRKVWGSVGMMINKDWVALLISCCCSVILLEAVLKATTTTINKTETTAAVGTLLTFCQFLTVTLLTAIKTGLNGNKKFGTEGQATGASAPLPHGMVLVLIALFFSSSFLGNWAYEMKVPVPVHALVKSGSLVCTAVLNAAFLGTRYSGRKKAAMAAVTAGVALCGIIRSDTGTGTGGVSMEVGRAQAAGTGLLLLSLLLGAATGLVQEKLYRIHGCSFEAVLFVSHALPLPFVFLFAGSSLREGYRLVNEAPGLIPVPVLLISSCLSQYYCVTTVSRFASKRSSVTVAFVLTLRKFLSIVLSVFLFDATFTIVHWISAILVFFGTILYANDSQNDIKGRTVNGKVKIN